MKLYKKNKKKIALLNLHYDNNYGGNLQRYALVTKDIPTRCLVVGNPAKVIRDNVEWK